MLFDKGQCSDSVLLTVNDYFSNASALREGCRTDESGSDSKILISYGHFLYHEGAVLSSVLPKCRWQLLLLLFFKCFYHCENYFVRFKNETVFSIAWYLLSFSLNSFFANKRVWKYNQISKILKTSRDKVWIQPFEIILNYVTE